MTATPSAAASDTKPGRMSTSWKRMKRDGDRGHGKREPGGAAGPDRGARNGFLDDQAAHRLLLALRRSGRVSPAYRCF